MCQLPLSLSSTIGCKALPNKANSDIFPTKVTVSQEIQLDVKKETSQPKTCPGGQTNLSVRKAQNTDYRRKINGNFCRAYLAR